MNTDIDRETRDILKIIEDENYFPSLPEHRKTAVVSLAAVTFCWRHLEYVPEWVISKEFEGKEICRTALDAKDADCRILPYIPYSDVLKEAIEQFSAHTPAFVLYSFADTRTSYAVQVLRMREWHRMPSKRMPIVFNLFPISC